MARQPLTKRQHEVYDFIVRFICEQRYSPTCAKINKAFVFRSPSSSSRHVQTLVRKGWVRVNGHQQRGIEIAPAAVPARYLQDWFLSRRLGPGMRFRYGGAWYKASLFTPAREVMVEVRDIGCLLRDAETGELAGSAARVR